MLHREREHGVPLDRGTLQVWENIWWLFIFKELIYQTVGGHFFIFAKKIETRSYFTLRWDGFIFHTLETPFLTHFNYYFLTLTSSIIFYSVDKF
jgi:hypothetical protein